MTFTAALLLCAVSSAGATPGALDRSFGGFGDSGVLTAADGSRDMALAPDGKIVSASGVNGEVIVRRRLSNGDDDPGFGSGGTVTVSNPGYSMLPTAVAVQADGRIIVAGFADASNQPDDFLVFRLNTTGTVDGSFGVLGYRTIDFAQDHDRGQTMLIQPDGRILVAGAALVGGDYDFAVARLTASGALDNTFSGDGKVTIPFGSDDFCKGLALQEDGKIVVVGSGADAPADVCVGRLNANGTLDTSFDSDGKRSVGLGGSDSGQAVAIQSSGKIVVGAYDDPVQGEGKLVRLHADGALDASFDSDGIMSIPNTYAVWDLAIQPDDRIVFAAESQPDNKLRIFRRLATGQADPTFGGDGDEVYQLDGWATPQLSVLSDGRILVRGSIGSVTAMIRVWPDGSLDEGGYQAFAFNENGIPAGTGFPPGSSEELKALALQPDGKLVAAGAVIHSASGESDFAVARFKPDGELDTSFGLYGRATFSFHNLDYATAVAIQPDGKIVVGGYTGPSAASNINFLVVRFLPDGTLDPTFGFSGFNVIDFMGGPDYAYAMALAPDGKIVIAGTVFNGVHDVMGVARFTSDGIADVSFDLDARQLVEFDPGASHSGTCVLVQPDLKIVAGGDVGGDFALMRLTEWGSLDDTFGCQGGIGGGGVCSGRARIDMGGDDHAYGVARAPNGWLYLGGYRIVASSVNFAIAQFNANGQLQSCPPFPCENWPDGRAYLNFNDYDTGFAMDVRTDGQIVVAGRTNGMFAWGQYGPTSPIAHVTAVTDLPGQELGLAVRFVGSGRLVVGGQQNFNGDTNFILAKYETTPDLTVGVPNAALPEAGLFEALGPNPAREGANLTFTLSQASAVEMRVHDVSGRLLRMETTGPLPPGRHQLRWDGRAADGSLPAAAVLFVSLRAEGRPIGQRTLVLVR